MADIFLSYSREDQAIAHRFAEGLRREGFSVWWDQTLRSGDNYDRITEQALKEAKAIVVLWSHRSVESRWVRSEATIADRLGRLVPVMITDCDRPLMFELTQAAELSRWKGNPEDPAWKGFVDDVRRYVTGEVSAVREYAGAGKSHALRVRTLMLGVAAGILLLGGAGLWLRYPHAVPTGVKGQVSIAVLPFVDMTEEKRDAALAEGLPEEILNWLAQIPQFHVVARTSSFVFKGANQDVRAIGRQLGATHVLEGSVRRGGDVVRITVQMIAVEDGLHLWSKTFNLPSTDALRIEDAVSRSVAESLHARLSDETERRWQARKSQEPQVYDLYLEGRYEQAQGTGEHNLRAMDLYHRAIAQDPRYALSYVGLAETTLNSVPLNGRVLADVSAEVTTLLDEADRLSPDLSDSIAARGWLAMDEYRTQDALELMLRAIALNPNDAATQRRLGNLYARMAQPRLAAERFDVAAGLDPLDFFTHLHNCLNLQDLAEHVAAEAACTKARALEAKNMWGPLATAWLEYARGNLPAALQWLDRAVALAPKASELQGQRVPILLQLGRYEEAREAIEALPAEAVFERDLLEGMIALATQDQPTLASHLDAMTRRNSELDMTQYLDLAHLQLAAGNAAAAKAVLETARKSSSWQSGALAEPDFVRLGYSAGLIVAGIESAVGNRDAAGQALSALDDTLDRFEAGGAACGGLYLLRAESQAIRGDSDRAMASLRKASERGWRDSKAARSEPLLRTLHNRPDFQQLMAQVDRQSQSGSLAAVAKP